MDEACRGEREAQRRLNGVKELRMIGTGEQKQASNTTAVDLRERSSKEGLASGFVLIADDGEDPYGR